ncbi:hypothetical protein SAMN00768000_2869 [Sulfobacillus thermosulfidooxidans DSM 9293]|uniref:Uncharacterized protein n=1 Tax=Sulfobacillus thermosulfidooxidans (strain DSM 9293 / VKM B-1269 / AT-1) TaxID=929705 RepID=A0A1W1WJQ6_SULTA|nr:hypothetical protein [Sulfobacillus thermosulfidooxidans]SMC06531.1 hypothetical protein SAMN00768000_2869 [Sulfobacillus thermosulfidooxidans DSM 9293]
MEEKNILAFFRSLEQAQRCQEALRHQGFDVIQIDAVPADMGNEILNHAPLVDWGRYGYDIGRLDDKWTASGAWTHQGLSVGAWILTAVVPASDRDHVAHTITEFGGQL